MGNARTKLNLAHLNGCLLVSAVLGWVAQSWSLFLVALAVMIGCGVYVGEIRPVGGRR